MRTSDRLLSRLALLPLLAGSAFMPALGCSESGRTTSGDDGGRTAVGPPADAAAGQGQVDVGAPVDAAKAPAADAGAPADAAKAPAAETGAGDTGGGDAGAALSFVPSNVPAAALAGGAPGDLLFNGTNCSNTNPTIDTDNGTLSGCGRLSAGTSYRYVRAMQADGSEVGVFVTRALRIDPTFTVRASGQLPLVIVALGRADIFGRLSVAAQRDKGIAGGFLPRTNMRGTGNGPGAGLVPATGGGGGGSYCGLGGKGGSGNAAGSKYGKATLIPLLGGSSGANGSIYEAGAGGGALQIVAGGTISISATGIVTAGGGGGSQAGAGGGSGGVILLEAPSVTIAGALAANGGGGGSGGGAVIGEDATEDERPAKGGLKDAKEGPGGNGAAGASANGSDGLPNINNVNGDNTGGGGGGAGWIRINTTGGTAAIDGKISPALATGCATQGTLP